MVTFHILGGVLGGGGETGGGQHCVKWLINKLSWSKPALLVGAGVGAGTVQAKVEAEVTECCSTGLGNDCAVWKQDGGSAGRPRRTAEEGGPLVGLVRDRSQSSRDSWSFGPMRKWKGMK